MAPMCGGDPVRCIDFAVLFIVEYLKDWTTQAMLAILLVLLFMLRAELQQATEDAYAKRLGAIDDKLREATGQGPGRPVEGERNAER
ncbi:MAG: hypothetical protein Q7S85_00070 [Rugosibacter sp.]|nr:hypothetical protein [Rugosibacter sp.]